MWPSFHGCSYRGRLDIADVQIFAVEEAWDEKEADAELPPSEKLRWGEEPVWCANGREPLDETVPPASNRSRAFG